MKVEIVPICRREEMLRDMFSEDKALIETYHIDAGKGIESCVKRTFDDMKKFSEYSVHAIENGEGRIAYFGREIVGGLLFMTGFHIKTKYRTKEFISYFWEMVKRYVGPENVFTSVYKKNSRAVDFLLKNGEIVFETTNTLTFKIL